MKNILFDISGKIDTGTVEVLRAIKEVAESLQINFFVVGASARDIILEHCYNASPRRGTRDIDIGVEVADWDEFQMLSEKLIATGKFVNGKEEQRFIFNKIPIDIMPFGLISDENKNIAWPPEHVMIMNMQGFEEAYRNAITVRISSEPNLDIKVPTLPGLALMKLISWKDRAEGKQKDAKDILFIMENYYNAGNDERLYDQYSYMLEESSFDATEAGARLLGRDMAQIADQDTLDEVMEILSCETEEQGKYRLVLDIISGSLESANTFDTALNLLVYLKHGIDDFQES